MEDISEEFYLYLILLCLVLWYISVSIFLFIEDGEIKKLTNKSTIMIFNNIVILSFNHTYIY